MNGLSKRESLGKNIAQSTLLILNSSGARRQISSRVLNIEPTFDGVLLTPHSASSKQRHVANLPRGTMPRAASSRGRHNTVPFGVKQIVLLFVK